MQWGKGKKEQGKGKKPMRYNDEEDDYWATSVMDSKVEKFADPDSYDGLPGKFKEWWMKMKAWLKANPCHFQNQQNGVLIWNIEQTWFAILSQLKGQKGA